MHSQRTARHAHGPALGRCLVLLLGTLFFLPVTVDAQYFGRNKVQYDTFDFEVLVTPHFDLHFYPEKAEIAEDLARMSERWYERLARLFQHEFEDRKPLIFYADHPDFQQTNTIGGDIGEGTGGVTEGLKNRVVMPVSSSYASTDHVLGHELVHAFQFNIAQSRRGGGFQGLMTLPLWLVEGMAEYLSVGNEDALTGMWLRDALLRDDFPTLRQLTREARFFPYRFGQAFWTYVGGTYGDETVVRLFRSALRVGWEPAIQQVLGIPADTLSLRWKEAAEAHYRPRMESRTPPGEAGTLLLAPSTGAGRQNVAPSISPDGSRMVFISEKDLFSFDLFLADARTGEVIRRLSSAAADAHFDALRFIDSSGAWSPDGERIAFVVFADGRNHILVADAERGDILERIRLSEEIGEVTGPSWSPDGRTLVFSGQARGTTDLYLVDAETHEVTELTRDRHAVLQPVFSPDGATIAFVTDRGPETDFTRLVYSEMRIALMDLSTREIEVLDLFGNVKHMNPQYTPDGGGLYFISDPDGFSDIFRLELESREVQRVTQMATAVSGITSLSPAMSVARETGTVVFSIFDEFEFHVYSVDSRDLPAQPALLAEMDGDGRLLPPARSQVPSRVLAYLGDPETGLPSPGTYTAADAEGYDRSLSLDYITQPTVAAGSDQFGNFVGGSVAAFFSDMLGNRNLGVGIQAQGTVKDIGGQFVYQNRETRWNWGVGGGRIPYLIPRGFPSRDPETGGTRFDQELLRIYNTQAFALTSYPFSRTRRVDFAAGMNRYAFDLELETIRFLPDGRFLERTRETRNDLVPDPVNLFETSAALVGDNSFQAFTSPIRGSRYRLELGHTLGSRNFISATADYRRYFNPTTNLTFAFRGLHFGRYGDDLVSGRTAVNQQRTIDPVQPVFLGREGLVRGYSAYSFDVARECIPTEEFEACPVYERLIGHRIGVVNAEIRVPLIGTERLGLFNFGFLPTELSLFTDAGLAWDKGDDPSLEFTRDLTAGRVPVVSSGVSARFNLMGFLILEAYYAYPFQRPAKGWHWGFNLAPGW